MGVGLNAYDVMAVDRVRRSPLARRRGRVEPDWSPNRHRVISGADVLELLPALAGRAPTGGYLFYDCQTDDSRLVLTVLAEAERFGAVAANRVECTGLLEKGGRAVGAFVRDLETGDELEVRATNVVNATGVWADRLRPAELHDEAEVPVIRPSRGTHVLVERDALPMSAAAIIPAGESADLRAAVARPDADRHHRHRPRRSDRARPAVRSRDRPPARRGQRLLRDLVGAGRPRGRLRGCTAADLDRRPAQVGRHLAQGRALRDVVGDDHDHRRQADDLAADGQGDRRPGRLARRLGGRVPHARGAARHAGLACRPRGRAGRDRGSSWPRATGTSPTTCWRWVTSSRSSPGGRTCWPRWPTPRAASRRARSATCCCGARGWG